MPKGKCVFNKVFVENDKYKSWLKPGKTVHSAKYIVCDSEFTVDWGCESAIKSRERGSTHTKNIDALESSKKGLAQLFRKTPTYFHKTSSSASATCNNSAASSTPSQSKAIDQLVA